MFVLNLFVPFGSFGPALWFLPWRLLLIGGSSTVLRTLLLLVTHTLTTKGIVVTGILEGGERQADGMRRERRERSQMTSQGRGSIGDSFSFIRRFAPMTLMPGAPSLTDLIYGVHAHEREARADHPRGAFEDANHEIGGPIKGQ